MKWLLFISLFFVATPAFAQAITSDESLFVEVQPAVVSELATTRTATTSEIMIGATTTEAVATTTEVTESITIVPGGLSLKLSATVPVVDTATKTSRGQKEDGIFDLIYTGFEEFVFKVFGV